MTDAAGTGESTFSTKADFTTETANFGGTNKNEVSVNTGNTINANQTDQSDKEEEPLWKKTMKTYTQNFTLHGLTRALHGQLWERIFWGCVLTVLCILIMIHVSGQMSKYLDYGIYTNFEIRYKGEVTFPSVTICDKAIIYRPMTVCDLPVEEESVQGAPICDKEYRMRNTKGSPGFINADGVYEHPLLKISVQTYNKHLEKVKMNHFESLSLYNHRCVTWNPAGNVTKGKYGLAIMDIEMKDPQNVFGFVVTHGPGEYFELSQGVTATLVMPSMSQRLNLKATNYERLPKPYPSQCRDVRMPESSVTMSQYSRKLCIDLRIPVTELENCGSVDDYFYPFISDHLFEKYGKAQTLGEFNQCRKNLKQTDIQTNKLRECDPPCRQTQVKTSVEQLGPTMDPKMANFMIKLVNSDTVDYVVEKKLYEWNIMVADMGGLIGLLNGSSICSALEVVIAVGLFLFGKKHMAELLYHQHLEQHLHLHGLHHQTTEPTNN
ncbi:uncharacterized protein [Clytia hemisphaerica]|uniref:Uncharacterized protein n=1 Tax=Clytia hemisphaerica TaxID=252671 RepID=A0A7M5UWK6_9CNID|eukprot:TCONS_00024171-protein